MRNLLFTFCLALFCSTAYSLDQVKVKQGYLDLSQWDPSHTATISLDGEWEFYWQRLFQWDERIDSKKTFIQFSQPWSEQPGKLLPEDGYATYAALITLPENVESISLKVPAVYNSYALWVNDQLVSRNGLVADNSIDYKAEWKPDAIHMKVEDRQLRVIFQIANFQGTRGGSAEYIVLSSGDTLLARDNMYRLSGKVITVIFFAAGFLGIVFFLFTTQINALYFSLMIFAFGFRFLFSDRYLHYDFFSKTISWNLVARIEYLSVPLIILWGSLFFAEKYPHEFKRAVKLFFVLVNLLLMACVIAAPTSILSELLTIIQIVALAFLATVIYFIIKALVSKKYGAWTSALGILVFALIGTYNVVAYLNGFELNHVLIDAGYTVALVLNAISLFYRTPLRIGSEDGYELKYTDFFPESGGESTGR